MVKARKHPEKLEEVAGKKTASDILVESTAPSSGKMPRYMIHD